MVAVIRARKRLWFNEVSRPHRKQEPQIASIPGEASAQTSDNNNVVRVVPFCSRGTQLWQECIVQCYSCCSAVSPSDNLGLLLQDKVFDTPSKAGLGAFQHSGFPGQHGALETMLYTLDVINSRHQLPFTLGAHILHDCDKDTYGLEMAVDFIKG
ncbi:hypothetical protein J6590_075245 [Homalodisca vitripennis]|nr:hypothetical protein J6590_075245 [Homalodisca vitripennis]